MNGAVSTIVILQRIARQTQQNIFTYAVKRSPFQTFIKLLFIKGSGGSLHVSFFSILKYYFYKILKILAYRDS